MACDRLIEIAEAAGFRSKIIGSRPDDTVMRNLGDGVVPYLLD